MGIYFRQNVAVATDTVMTATIPLKDELVYRIILSCKNDGMSEIDIPNLKSVNEQESKLTVESYLDLDIVDIVDDDYVIKVTNSYASNNEITIIILTMSLQMAKKLKKLGLFSAILQQKIPQSEIAKGIVL